MVRQRSAKPLFIGSIPIAASNISVIRLLTVIGGLKTTSAESIF